MRKTNERTFTCCAEHPPPHIRRTVVSHLEKHKQENDTCILSMSNIQPEKDSIQDTASSTLSNPMMTTLSRSSHIQTTPHQLSSSLKESLPQGSSEAWHTWPSVNRLRIGNDDAKPYIPKWIQRGWTENVHTWG